MTFGKPEDTTIIIGDWSAGHVKFQAPAKGKGFRRMFKQAGYDVFLVNERLSSSICPSISCKQRTLENFRHRPSPRPWRRGHYQTVHGLLRCTSVNCQFSLKGQLVDRMSNRDDVATLDLRAIVYETIGSVSAQFPQGVRPARFT